MSAIKWLITEIGQKIDTYEIPDIVIAEALEIEELRLKEAYRDGQDFAIINQSATESTSAASSYSDGYKDGYNRAIELTKWAISNLIPPSDGLQ